VILLRCPKLAQSSADSRFGHRMAHLKHLVFLLTLVSSVLSVSLSAQGASASEPSRGTLQPEPQPPVVDLCTTAVHVAIFNGDVWPVTCDNGRVNVAAWSILKNMHSGLMRLGRQATLAQTEAAFCISLKHMTSNQANSVYRISAAYNGWRNRTLPFKFLSTGCRRQVM
jgi:hypothetical protein